MNFLLIDFEDSFTLNIASLLRSVFPSSKINILKWSQAAKIMKNKDLYVILGPGPGKPEQYKGLFPFIRELLDNNKRFLYGICLGHQLIGELLGFSLKRSERPLHGLKRTYELSPNWNNFFNTTDKSITVQHYNSLCLLDNDQVKTERFIVDNEVLMMKGKNFFSCQFHPESIATHKPESFFKFLRDFKNE